eukprot:m.242895 g.242895  ORF g.242895 m.242895 type:complete len:225 (+) comp54448_c0_seq2:131-805(+)
MAKLVSLNDLGRFDALVAANQLPTLGNLFLSHLTLGDEGAIRIIRELPKCTSLQGLYLGSNSLSIRTVRELLKVVPHINKTLTALSLQDNQIGDESVPLLRELMASCLQLNTLWIHGCGITEAEKDNIAKALASHPGLHDGYVVVFSDRSDLKALVAHGRTFLTGQFTKPALRTPVVAPDAAREPDVPPGAILLDVPACTYSGPFSLSGLRGELTVFAKRRASP